MFEFKPSGFIPGNAGLPPNPRNRYGYLYQQAIIKFNIARNKAWIHQILSTIRRIPTCLIDLETIPKQQVRNRFSAGTIAINLNQVYGTISRMDTFDNHFNPLSDRVRERWVSIAIARLSFLPLSPVQLIKVGSTYFVQDGHHRISVARALGESAIDADVIVWEVQV